LDLWLLLALATLVFRVTGFQQRPKG
jgi:hypothetical protein